MGFQNSFEIHDSWLSSAMSKLYSQYHRILSFFASRAFLVTTESTNPSVESTESLVELRHQLESERAARVAAEELMAATSSELQSLNRDLREMLNRAEESNRAKSEFLANMNHELRTPLNAIIGFAEIMKEDAQDDGDSLREEDADKILISAKRLLTMIGEILDLARIEAGKMHIDLGDFSIGQLVERVSLRSPSLVDANGNRFTVNCDVPDRLFRSDLEKLNCILINLIGNAGKFTENGEIALTITPAVIQDVEFVRFDVSDTGIGIESKKIDALFDRFAQLDGSSTRRHAGAGLGLALCKELTSLLGGNVYVESELGAGSTFTVELPLLLHLDDLDD